MLTALVVIVLVLIALAARVHAAPVRSGSWDPAGCAQARDDDDDDDCDDDDRDEPAPVAPHRSDDDLDFDRFFDHDDTAAGDREAYEARLRDRPASPWGRLDVGFAVRHHDNAPAHAPAYQTGELWLVATWRR